MEKLSLKELAVPLIKAIDSFNYLLKSHHRRVAFISYSIGKRLNLNDEDLSELVIAAALHDIGALSVQERDMLVQEDVENPDPHCKMGYKMLAHFEVFGNIAQIIKHHHIKYQDSLKMKDENIFFASHIIHLADRVDILILQDDFILNQKNTVIEGIRKKVGTVFHPEVFSAFEKVAKADIFWMDINNMRLGQLLDKINFSIDFTLSVDNVLEFALTISRIIDFRSKFTASHSYTVAHLASFFGNLSGYSEEKCKKLMIAGYLHDIGKIGIDPGLIEKNGPLSEEEFNVMKLHTYYTGQILHELNTLEWFKEIVTWAEKHHEKSDGSGYPYAEEDVNLDEGVKILAYADVVTALMEDRPYREGLPIDKAFAIIEENIAPHIFTNLFQKIKQHKEEVNTLVKKCQKYTYKDYHESIQ
jgi:HD-GYP domain-containing protein (c-di-GMP phosphodiesterase class II)